MLRVRSQVRIPLGELIWTNLYDHLWDHWLVKLTFTLHSWQSIGHLSYTLCILCMNNLLSNEIPRENICLTFMRWADSQKTSRLTSEFSLKTDVFWSGILTGLCQYILHLFGRVSCIVLLVIINLYKTQTPGWIIRLFKFCQQTEITSKQLDFHHFLARLL